MTEFYRNYLAVAVFIGAALLMVGAMLGRRHAAPPDAPAAARSYVTYEAGSDPVLGGSASRTSATTSTRCSSSCSTSRPCSSSRGPSSSRALGVFGLVEMIVFIVILTLGLVYAWRKGVLRWA